LRINLISGLDEESAIESVYTPNQVYAWFLRKGFIENGVDARLINESNLLEASQTDHTIVVSSASSYRLRDAAFIQKLRSSTTGKLACYMNIDKLRGVDRYFDYFFTQVGPVQYRPEKYICAGWGVDPSYSYPEQGGKAAFLDSKTLHPRQMRKVKKAYQIYDDVLPRSGVTVYNPVRVYNESDRLSYPDYQAILRKCHFFLCTQYGDGGINRLEAAACGALLVVPTTLYRNRTMSLLNHQVWDTEEDLKSILHEEVDVESNRQRALKHRWGAVAKRIIGVLENE
jgi:hypothetical protein